MVGQIREFPEYIYITRVQEIAGMVGLHSGNLQYLQNSVQESDIVLDLGCRRGDDMEKLHCKTISADIEFYSTTADVQYCFADGTKLPFSRESFDYILCNQVLEHVRDQRALIAEIARVLRPGGEAIISFPNRLSPHQPHGEVPWWYSYVPRPIGERLTDQIDAVDSQFYHEFEFMLSPLKARYYIHDYFNDIEYSTFKHLSILEPGRNSQSGLDPIRLAILLLASLLAYLAAIPLLGWGIELFYPYVEYSCSKPKPGREKRNTPS